MPSTPKAQARQADLESADPSLPRPPSGERPSFGAIQVGAESSHITEAPPPSSARSVGEGDLLDGKYRLVRKLSEGGMGAVYVARNETLDIDVAVKLIRADLDDIADAKLPERLMQEARAAARLGHPAIVRVQDFGRAPTGDPYIVMELLEGEDLGAALERRGRISPAKAVRSLLPIAHALAAAHDKGIVHRDLKPDNIFLAQQDDRIQPMLIDFGVAKLRKQPAERITQVGAALGTPDYMSPEQACGEDVDHQADVWAFSVVLFEMTTGRLPFRAKNYHSLLRAIIEKDVPTIASLGVRDAALSAILDRGLAKQPEHRWSAMREYGRALAQWLLERGAIHDICGASLEAVWLQQRPLSGRADAFASIPPPSSSGVPRAGAVVLSHPPPEIAIPPHSSEAPSDSAPPSSRRSPEPSSVDESATTTLGGEMDDLDPGDEGDHATLPRAPALSAASPAIELDIDGEPVPSSRSGAVWLGVAAGCLVVGVLVFMLFRGDSAGTAAPTTASAWLEPTAVAATGATAEPAVEPTAPATATVETSAVPSAQSPPTAAAPSATSGRSPAKPAGRP